MKKSTEKKLKRARVLEFGASAGDLGFGYASCAKPAPAKAQQGWQAAIGHAAGVEEAAGTGFRHPMMGFYE